MFSSYYDENDDADDADDDSESSATASGQASGSNVEPGLYLEYYNVSIVELVEDQLRYDVIFHILSSLPIYHIRP